MKRKILGILNLICAAMMILFEVFAAYYMSWAEGPSDWLWSPYNLVIMVAVILAMFGGIQTFRGKTLWWAITAPASIVIIILDLVIMDLVWYGI